MKRKRKRKATIVIINIIIIIICDYNTFRINLLVVQSR